MLDKKKISFKTARGVFHGVEQLGHVQTQAQPQIETFRTRAQILVDRGIPFTALHPGTKVAIIKEWEKNAFSTIEDADNSPHKISTDCNVGAIAQAKLGGF